MKGFIYQWRWWIAGSGFAGIAAACYAKHGAVEYAAQHVWEEADQVAKLADSAPDSKPE
jgi:thioredoxin reductase